MVKGLNSLRARGSLAAILLAFASIYLIWGSTYLAIRYAVETIPPLVTAGVRHLTAGAVLLTWAIARGYRPTKREWYTSSVLGLLFFLVGHGSLHWAEQSVPSGLAALLVATEPMWVAVLALFMGNERQSVNLPSVAGLVLGFVGVVLLSTDSTITAQSTSILGVVAILGGTLSWSFGMFYSKQAQLPKDALARAAMPMFCGAVQLLVVAGLSGEFKNFAVRQVSMRSYFGLLYLIVFGSIVAFTAYTWLLKHCSASLIATHTYVNPVVAVLLGWVYAGEPLTARTGLAAVLVVIAVVAVTMGSSGAEEKSASTNAASAAQDAA